MITLLFFLIFYRKPKLRKLNITYSIATTGFFGMLMNLALIFCFQVFYGYLYHRIGILISVFMAGIALGSIFMTAGLEKIKNALKLFMVLEFLIILFSYLVAFTITSGIPASVYTGFIFTLLFFVSGLLMGLEFPLASKIYSRDREAVGEVSGVLYAADLTGGWLAGIMGGIILLPILGFFNTCMVIIMFKLSSLALLIFVKSDNPA
jgi:spermidine synthase